MQKSSINETPLLAVMLLVWCCFKVETLSMFIIGCMEATKDIEGCEKSESQTIIKN